MEILDIIYIVSLFVIGMFFGSFFSLATFRIPRKQDIVIKQSYCPNCEHKLGFFDLFPVFSYVLLGGKCRYCKQKISIRYPLFELSNGILFILFYLIFGISIGLIVAVLLYSIAFVGIGSWVNYTKLNKNKENNEEKKLKVNSGFINAELVAGVAIYAIFFVSIIIITHNSNIKAVDIQKKSNATNLAVSTIEDMLIKEYSDVISYSDTVNVEGTEYKRHVSVSKYSDTAKVAKDVIKTITVKIEYKNNNNGYDNFELKTVKVNNEGA